MKKGKVLGALLAVFVLVAGVVIFTSYLQAGVKDVACNTIGCPNGPRMCGTVKLGPVTYWCYEPEFVQ